MDITKLYPRGFCGGVVRAISLINKALDEDTLKKPIYMLGNIVHNKNVVNAFKERGIIILDGPSRVDMLKEITTGSVIFTAHGVSDEVREVAEAKGLQVLDATCRDVARTHNLIKEYLDKGYQVLFYGKENHPETEGILGISKNVFLVNEKTNLLNIPISSKMIITNQTTMSYLNLVNLHSKLQLTIPQLELMDEICSATRRRQEAVINAEDFDLIIVVGDPLSNNTRMLKEIAEKKPNTTAIRIESIADLEDFDLSIYKNIAITAGASTPSLILEEIIFNLENKTNNYVSKLELDDYLKT